MPQVIHAKTSDGSKTHRTVLFYSALCLYLAITVTFQSEDPLLQRLPNCLFLK